MLWFDEKVYLGTKNVKLFTKQTLGFFSGTICGMLSVGPEGRWETTLGEKSICGVKECVRAL